MGVKNGVLKYVLYRYFSVTDIHNRLGVGEVFLGIRGKVIPPGS